MSRPVLATVAGLIMTDSPGFCPTRAADDWPRAALADAGFASDLSEQIDARVRDGSFENLHAVLVARGGKLVLERYYEGRDEVWGRARGRVVVGPDTLHDLRSITKSIVGLLYGIALSGGEVPALDAPLVDQFPEYPDLALDPMRRRMIVAHALTMMLGTEWDEGLSYADPRNSEHAMELADDRYRFVLDRPMVAEPGTRWVYNGGATAVLGRLIAKGSGRSLRDYAERRLFAPLRIGEFEWVRGHDGEFIAASGLRLRPRDLARIGQLVLDGGRFEGRQIVPRGVARAVFPDARQGRRSGLRLSLVARPRGRKRSKLGRWLRQWRPEAVRHASARSARGRHGRQLQSAGRLEAAGRDHHRDRSSGVAPRIVPPLPAGLMHDLSLEVSEHVRQRDQVARDLPRLPGTSLR
jgi:CubicO group peptidase (beta-lactamase class C family)